MRDVGPRQTRASRPRLRREHVAASVRTEAASRLMTRLWKPPPTLETLEPASAARCRPGAMTTVMSSSHFLRDFIVAVAGGRHP